MGKDKKEEAKNEEAPGGDDSVGVVQNATPKFSVLDYPGIEQPKVTVAAATEEEGEAAGTSGKTKDGLQGRRAKAGAGPKIESGASIGGDSFVQREKDPSWLKDRVAAYETVKARREAELQNKKPVPISITMPDGKILDADKQGEAFMTWKTTPYHVAVAISQGLADSATVARVTYESFAEDFSPAEDGMEGEDMLSDAMADGGIETDKDAKTFLWDMTRPLVGTVAKMEFLKFEEEKDAKTVFWHSSAHMMGEALEHLYGCKLTIGPPLAGGFYYDSYMGKSDALRDEDCTSPGNSSTIPIVGPVFILLHSLHIADFVLVYFPTCRCFH